MNLELRLRSCKASACAFGSARLFVPVLPYLTVFAASLGRFGCLGSDNLFIFILLTLAYRIRVTVVFAGLSEIPGCFRPVPIRPADFSALD